MDFAKLNTLLEQRNRAKDAVISAARDLRLLEEAQKTGTTWTVDIRIAQRTHTQMERTVRINIPYGVVQQQLVYKLMGAKRNVADIENRILQETQNV